jgi:hypothetical protein
MGALIGVCLLSVLQLKERERTVGCLQERVVELQSTTQRLQEEQTACQAQLQQ